MTRIIIDDEFLNQVTSLSPEYNDLKNNFERVVGEKVNRQFIIFLALLNKRIEAIYNSLEKLEELEEKNIKKLNSPKNINSPEDLEKEIKRLNEIYLSALTEFKTIGSNLINTPYFTNALKNSSLIEECVCKIYNKHNVKLPERMTFNSDGYDIYLPTDVILRKGETVSLDTGLIIVPPLGFHIEIQIRSSLAKMGIITPVGTGIIDSDYCGQSDFIKVLLIYLGKEDSLELKSGTRVAQLRLIKNTPKINFLPISLKELKNDSRGGLGSTDA